MARPIHFLCGNCGNDAGSRLESHACSACGSAVSIQRRESRFPIDDITRRPATLWRYAEALLPMTDDPVTLGESTTPLVPFEIGGAQLLAKCEFTCPTGSYKDRGAALLMTYLKQSGTRAVVEDSSGNAGAAMAAYAARAGIDITIFCPASAAAGKLVQIQAYGATLRRVDGPRPLATDALMTHVAETGVEYASHLWHPVFLEGVKTLAFEICEQLNWSVPDTVLCPVGAGSILLGLYLGFSELRDAGIVKRLPRLVAVQAANNAALLQAFSAGDERVVPLQLSRPTVAEGIALPAPVRDRELLSALRESAGTVVAVEEAAILDGLKALGRCGFFVEPTAAVVWHGFELLQQRGFIRKGDTAVAVLSGHGLKAAQSLVDSNA